MKCSNEPEGEAKEKPGEHKRKTEDEEHPAPADIHTGGEDISKISLTLFTHVDKLHIAVSILLHKTAAWLDGDKLAIVAVLGGFH